MSADQNLPTTNAALDPVAKPIIAEDRDPVAKPIIAEDRDPVAKPDGSDAHAGQG